MVEIRELTIQSENAFKRQIKWMTVMIELPSNDMV